MSKDIKLSVSQVELELIREGLQKVIDDLKDEAPEEYEGDLEKDISTASWLLTNLNRKQIVSDDQPPTRTFVIEDKPNESDVWLIGDCLASRSDALVETLAHHALKDPVDEKTWKRWSKEKESVDRLLALFWPKEESASENPRREK